MLVSVLLPNYNHAPFLPARINSILEQSFRDFELIILDDASTDGSREQIAVYEKDPRVSHVIYNEKNSGSSFIQWQKGVGLAKGDFIWIAESDDTCEPGFLEKMVSLLQADPSVMIATCRSANIDEAGRVTAINTWHDDGFETSRWTKDFVNDGKQEIEHYLRYRNSIPNASAVLFRNKVGAELDELVALHWKYCGDWFFWAALLLRGKISYCSEVLSYHRHHGQTTRAVKNFEDERSRFAETVQCVHLINNAVNLPVNWKDRRYAWIHEFYTRRTSFINKLRYSYWNISTSPEFNNRLLREASAFYIRTGKQQIRLSAGRYRPLLKNILMKLNIRPK